ncbi:MAG: hypothetical protein NWR45_02610 [Candidatus Nanopelagicales bacterium]|nr:hypothetical protein [Candidatus Nanopelagicales bacterium]
MHTPGRLAVVLISGLIAASSLAIAPPASANGDCPSWFAGRGTGTPADPYQVSVPLDIEEIGYCLSASFIQMNDVALTGTWAPLGTSGQPFTGTYDGGGFSISNLNISLSTTDDVGLFGYISGATITGVNIISGSVTSREYVGAIVGRAVNSSITQSSSAASVSGVNQVGGIVGESAWATGPNRSLSQIFATGAVTASGNYVGGLAGVTTSLVISNTYATGSVSGDYQVGGLIGENNSSSLSNSYAIGRVTSGGPDRAHGGVMGQESAGTYSGVTWDVDTTGESIPNYPVPAAIEGNTTTAMKSIATFRDLGWSIGSLWTGNTTWVICPQANNGYPFLSAFYTAQTAPCINRSGPPPDVDQQVGRTAGQDCATAGNAELNIGGVASGSWGQSWAQWMNGATGGFVCNRTLYYNMAYGRWEVRT